MKERQYIFTPYPHWLRMPDPIVETCECGAHNRSWTLVQLFEAWEMSHG